MGEIKKLERRIRAIEERNSRVELDKSWETSWTRRVIVAALTYVSVVVFFYAASLPRPFVNSIVPTVAFVISTLSLPLFKGMWVRRRIKN